MASEVSKNWSGGKISSMVENERGAQFTIGFEKNQKPKVPDRYLQLQKIFIMSDLWYQVIYSIFKFICVSHLQTL